VFFGNDGVQIDVDATEKMVPLTRLSMISIGDYWRFIKRHHLSSSWAIHQI